jgi:hypothetical protein
LVTPVLGAVPIQEYFNSANNNPQWVTSTFHWTEVNGDSFVTAMFNGSKEYQAQMLLSALGDYTFDGLSPASFTYAGTGVTTTFQPIGRTGVLTVKFPATETVPPELATLTVTQNGGIANVPTAMASYTAATKNYKYNSYVAGTSGNITFTINASARTYASLGTWTASSGTLTKVNDTKSTITLGMGSKSTITIPVTGSASGAAGSANYTVTVANGLASGGTVAITGSGTSWTEVHTFAHNGSVQTLTTVNSGNYKFQLWGAQGGGGGYGEGSSSGGKGGYAEGTLAIAADESFYVRVGGQGSGYSIPGGGSGGYPGGAAGGTAYGSYKGGGGGGGATEVRITNTGWNDAEGLRSRIMVAAGGGGASRDLTGGVGAGASAVNTATRGGTTIKGAGQTALSSTTDYNAGTFGIGATGAGGTSGSYSGEGRGGGGGGYYGGSSGTVYGTSDQKVAPGTGGSGFVSGLSGCNAVSSATSNTASGSAAHYSGKTFTGGALKAGDVSMPNTAGTANETGHAGNGYAKISIPIPTN